jgi:predicted transcriptional regulator
MANTYVASDSEKVTITLSRALLERLRAHVPARQRRRFIEEALEERLAMEEQVAVLRETAGAWTDEGYPEMATDDDIDRWLQHLRAGWMRGEH